MTEHVKQAHLCQGRVDGKYGYYYATLPQISPLFATAQILTLPLPTEIEAYAALIHNDQNFIYQTFHNEKEKA